MAITRTYDLLNVNGEKGWVRDSWSRRQIAVLIKQVSALQGQIATLQSNYSALEARVSALEGNTTT